MRASILCELRAEVNSKVPSLRPNSEVERYVPATVERQPSFHPLTSTSLYLHLNKLVSLRPHLCFTLYNFDKMLEALLTMHVLKTARDLLCQLPLHKRILEYFSKLQGSRKARGGEKSQARVLSIS